MKPYSPCFSYLLSEYSYNYNMNYMDKLLIEFELQIQACSKAVLLPFHCRFYIHSFIENIANGVFWCILLFSSSLCRLSSL